MIWQVAQLQKQKAKKAGAGAGTESKKVKDVGGQDQDLNKDKEKAEGQDAESTPSSLQQLPSEVTPETELEQDADNNATEPVPAAPVSSPPGADSEQNIEVGKELPLRGSHTRQPSLSFQSKIRSSSFRRISVSNGASAAGGPTSPSIAIANLKSPPLPPLTPDEDSVHEVFRKQAARLEELERENKRLGKELDDANAKRKKADDQLEDLREASVETVELKDKLEKAEKKVAEIEKLVRLFFAAVPKQFMPSMCI